MKADIVIPTTGRRSLRGLIRSLENCNLESLNSVYVVYNGVVRGSITAVDSSALNITNLFEPNRGVNRARNLGLERCTADIAIFLDDDCEIADRDFIKKYIEAFGADKEATAIGGVYIANSSKNSTSRAYSALQDFWFFSGQMPDSQNAHLLGGNVGYSIKNLGKARFNEQIKFGGSETELHFRLRAAGHRLIGRSEIGVVHNVQVGLFQFFRRALLQGLNKKLLKLTAKSQGVENKLAELELYNKTSRFWPRLYVKLFMFLFSCTEIWANNEGKRIKKLSRYLKSSFDNSIRDGLSDFDARVKFMIRRHERRTIIAGRDNKDLNIK